MIKETNTRITITVSKKQNEFLEEGAKKLKISKSQFVKWLMDKNITRIADTWTEKEFEEIKRICKIKWVKK